MYQKTIRPPLINLLAIGQEKRNIQFEGHFEFINHEFVFKYLLKFAQWVQSLSEIKFFIAANS